MSPAGFPAHRSDRAAGGGEDRRAPAHIDRKQRRSRQCSPPGPRRGTNAWTSGAILSRCPSSGLRPPSPRSRGAKGLIAEIPRPAKRGEGGAERRVRGNPIHALARSAVMRCVLAISLLSISAYGHDFWIEPSTFRPAVG